MPHVNDSKARRTISAWTDHAPNPEQNLLREEKIGRANQALSRLTLQQQACLILQFEGLRYKDIGTALGVSTRQAAKLFKETMRKLVEELDPGYVAKAQNVLRYSGSNSKTTATLQHRS